MSNKFDKNPWDDENEESRNNNDVNDLNNIIPSKVVSIKLDVLNIIFICIILWLMLGFCKINTNQKGVVLYFGKFYRILEPGLNYVLPTPISKLYKVPVTNINKEEFGFRTKNEAFTAGQKAYNEFINGGIKQESEMFYSDYLDYWMKEYFEINYKYSTARRYKETFGAIKKELGMYRLNTITPYLLNQVLLKLYQKTSTKEALRNYQKVIKSSLRDAAYYFGFIENNPAGDLQIPRVLSFELKKTI